MLAFFVMPYATDSKDLPEHVQKMPVPMREAWVETFNSVHDKCMVDEGEDCEGMAMRVANSQVEKMRDEMGQASGRFAELIGKRLSRKGRELLAAAKQAIDEFFQYADERETAGEDEEEGDVEEMAGEYVAGQFCPHDDCDKFLTFGNEIGWYKCGNCGRSIYVEDTDSDFEDYHVFTEEWANKKNKGEKPANLPVAKVQGRSRAQMTAAPFLMIELTAASLVVGKPFDGVVFGSFLDMYGREVKLDPKDKAAYIANTKRAIEATRGESGELAGLPIDAKNHDKGDAAGWIVDVIDGGGDLIRFLANWTEIGVELIGKGIRRFFSPTINTAGKVILGGSLANWIASTDKDGIVKLRPLELAQGVHTFEKTISDLAAKRPHVLEQDKEIADMTDEQVTDLVNSAVEKSLAGVMERIGAVGQSPAPAANGNGAGHVDLAALLQLDKLEPEAQERIELALQEQFNAVQKAAELSYMQKLAQVNRKRTLAELATRVTGGTDAAPRGLPVQAEKLTEALLKLPADQVQFWSELCEGTVKNGLMEFTELGHGKEMQGTAELSAPYKKLLNEWVDGGGNLAEFFAVNADVLGSMSQYNLADFKGGK